MPLVKGLSVTVHTRNGPLTEYDTKSIGSGSIISSFIQSEDNTPFWINFSPSDPFDFQIPPGARPTWHSAKVNSPVRKSQLTSWDFSAHIYIDDNLKSDKNLIIDLPHNGKGHDPIVTARGRSCVDQKGISGEQGWMFKEVGIEDYFKKLTTDEKMEGGEDEWEMIPDSGSKHDIKNTTNMGQIKIKLFRVHQRGVDTTKKPDRLLQSSPEHAQINSDIGISHTIKVGKAKPRTFHYVAVDYLDGPRDPWATIVFMYRGKKQLQRMGFTLGKGPARRNSFGIFQPGLPKPLDSSPSTITFDDIGRFDDPETPTKALGSMNPFTTMSYASGDSKGLGMRGGKRQGLLTLESKNFTTPPQSRPAICNKLKRKPSHQTEITASLSAMSLNNKDGLCYISDLDFYNNSGRTSLKKKRIGSGSMSATGLACLQKQKVKEEADDKGEKISDMVYVSLRTTKV